METSPSKTVVIDREAREVEVEVEVEVRGYITARHISGA